MFKLSEGELYETARERLIENGFTLDSLTWDDSNPKMEIGYRHNGLPVSLDVRGLPTDIPLNVFDELVTHLIRTQLKGQKKLALSKDTIAYIIELRIKKKVNQ